MDELDEQDKRIAAILNEDEPPGVSYEALRKYLTYLRANVVLPCSLTGIETSIGKSVMSLVVEIKEYEKLKTVLLILMFSHC